MRCRDFNPALISFARLVALLRPSVCSRQHTVSISFIVSRSEIPLELLDHLRVVTGFFIFFRQTEHDHRISGIAGEHLFKDFDA